MVESSGASEDSLDITTVGDREGYFDILRENLSSIDFSDDFLSEFLSSRHYQ